MKQVRIGVVGYCPPTKYDENKALEYLAEAFSRVETDFSDRKIVIVSGATNVGVLAQAYKLATEKGYETGGVACEKAVDYELFPTTEKPVIVGKNWGDESPVFLHGISRIKDVDPGKIGAYSNHPHYGLDAMIRIGTGLQSIRETAELQKHGKLTYEFDLPKLEEREIPKELRDRIHNVVEGVKKDWISSSEEDEKKQRALKEASEEIKELVHEAVEEGKKKREKALEQASEEIKELVHEAVKEGEKRRKKEIEDDNEIE